MHLKTGERIHLKNPDYPKNRILHSGQVVAIEGENVIAEFRPPRFAVAPESEFVVFYETRRKFVQQSARIETVEEGGEIWPLRLALIGDAAPAEGREVYRVTTINSAIEASLGEESACPVVDVSSTGFALIARQKYAIGTTVDASIEYGGECYAGEVVIQSIQERRDGTRYGVRYLERDGQPSAFAGGLNQISMAVQREQLARQGLDS